MLLLEEELKKINMIGQKFKKDTATIRPPGDKVKLFLAVINIILFCLFIFSLLTLYIVRIVMFIIFLIFAVTFLVIKKYVSFAACVLYMAVIFYLYWYPNYMNWEIQRFHFVRGAYERQVENIIDDPSVKDTKDMTNIFSERRENIRYLFLTQSCAIEYKKIDDSILIYFPTRATLFDEEGYIYFSDDKMKDYMEHPNNYNPTFLEKGYKDITYYDSNWAYIICY